MSFNLLIDSKNNTQFPNPLVIDPLLDYFYTFNNSDLSGNVLKNQGISQAYDLLIESGSVNGTFSGTSLDSTIETPSITLNATWSIGFWVYFNNNTQAQIVFGLFNTENYANGVSVYYRENTTQLNFRDETATNSNGANNTVTTIPIQTWTHIVWVNLGTSWLCYKNGVLVTTLTGKVSNSSFVKNFNYIGRGITANPIRMNGQLDGFFVYNGTLSASQISDIYSKGQQPAQTNYWYTIPIQPFTYTYANNSLQYWFDFNARPKHPYGTNKYKVYSSFISYGTASGLTHTNMLYYLIYGLGTENIFIGRGGNPANSMPNNNLIKNITFNRGSQKWIDEDPTMPFIIQNLNDTGIINVEIRLISSNQLSLNASAWGAQTNDYLIQLLFEPIP